MNSSEQEQVRQDFSRLVNMTATELKKWLGTKESEEAGQHKEGGESTGHASGRHIVHILQSKKADLSEDDFTHMQKVNGYIHRHLAQRPSGDIQESRWRHSLMNWGHDPLKQ
ncbi:DUF3140 domain-containing protein [Streptomyces sp. NPDC051320]|uniref:DUF3140 domain-containing protein n=1 Tax=Streptomyces sp. NPDC051320 TaxID=3154644 RepID=UPI00342547A7